MQSVFVKLQVEGFHLWEHAPQEVSFLKNRHRHIFWITVFFETTGDRQVEFFMLKAALKKWLADKFERGKYGYEFESCESLARDIVNNFHFVETGQTPYKVEVSEDNENGIIIDTAL